MNWSAATCGLGPAIVVTTTSTVAPLVPAGLVAVQLIVLVQLTPVAATLPKLTAVALSGVLRFVPLSVTDVPPAVRPTVGLMLLTMDCG